MIVAKKSSSKIEMDLTGPRGNAFCILATAKRLCKQLDMDFEKVNTEMTSGDYENLVSVFDKYFGDFVILYR